MVKNIPTIERSTKIRFGKHATDDQAENTIVFNASNVAIDASSAGGVYVTPMRTVDPSTPEITVLSYNTITKEILNSNTKSADLFNSNLHFVSERGNVTTNTLQFTNPTTAFITSGGVSIGSSISIDPNADNKIQVSGTIKTGTLHTDNIGIANTSPKHALSLGSEGQLRLNVPTESIYALETVGNVSAQNYIGDGGLLSNVTLQTVTDKSNITSNTIHLTNPTTSLKAYSNVIIDGRLDVGSNLYVEDTAADVLNVTGNVNVSNYLKTNKLEVSSLEVDAVTAGTISSNIVGNNVNVITVTANVIADNVVVTNISSVTLNSNVIADNVVATNISSVTLNSNVIADNVSATTITGDGSAITNLDPDKLSSQVLLAKGGTGLTSVAENGLLLGPPSGDALITLPPYNADATKKFLRSNDSGVEWDDVSSTLQAITTGGATTSDEVSFTNGVTSLTASGNVVATGNVTASTFKSTTLTSGKIPYVNNDNELIDGPVGYDSTTNNTFVSSNLYVTGNLIVQGETSFQDSNIHVISDPLIELGNANVIDNIDMGVIMTRPTANVVSGYMGDEKKYVIAYTLSDPHEAHIVPTNATSDQFMTLSVEGGNVLAGNVTTTGKMTADNLELTGTGVIINATNGIVNAQTVNSQNFAGSGSGLFSLDLGRISHTGQVATARGGTGVTTGLTELNAGNITTGVLDVDHGGTGLTSIGKDELLLGPASGNTLQTLSPYSPAGTTVEYPTSALSSSANSGETIAGITYTTTASSNQYGQIWKAFDKTTPGQNTFWHSDENVYDSTSGAYTGSKSLGSVSGEWIKLQLSTAVAPTSVNITGRTSYDNQAPDSWEILGSTNNTSWTSLLSSTVHATYNGGSGHTVSISGASAYTYLALVVKARGGTGQTAVVISELRFFTSTANLSKKFLRSSGTGIAWDDVSSDLQTITDGGATTTHTVAFNNTTTGLTSAGDITISDTKQIDYAGDVLLKSSAGAVASLKVDNAIKLDPAYASPSNNVLSFNTTTGEIYDSGGQGGSTLDNIHEEGSNVAIGPSAASANLTVNTYGSNVLTVTGNVSADNITIGGLNIAASPFGLDDTVSSAVGSNVTANVLTLGGLVTSGNVNTGNVITTGDITISGNTTSQNIKLTNTDISATISSGTITIDAREKSYGTAPLVVSTTDVSNLVFSNLITGAQIVVPILASGGDIKISKELTNVNFYAMTTDVSITQDKHALMTLSNLYGNIYMNAIGFA